MMNKDISKLSDFELNSYIAMLVNPVLQQADSDLVTEQRNGAANFRLCNAIGEDLNAGTYNYCDNWNELMPLVKEYGISSTYLKDGRACAYQYIRGGDENRPSTQAQHKDLQRALAETVLLVLQDKENKE